MSSQSKVAVQPWVPGDMSAPRYDFLTLLVADSQMWLADRWMTVSTTLPCATGAHGAMCSVMTLDDGWRRSVIAHRRLDERAWIRHRIEADDG
jgi:hypothetical protein